MRASKGGQKVYKEGAFHRSLSKGRRSDWRRRQGQWSGQKRYPRRKEKVPEGNPVFHGIQSERPNKSLHNTRGTRNQERRAHRG